jgi:hypothetical protein
MSKKNKNKKEQLVFPYAEIMLDNIRSEYDREMERKASLDNKSAAFISVNIMVITLLFPLIPWNTIKSIRDIECCYARALAIAFVWLLFAGIVILIFAFIRLVRAWGIMGYKGIDIEAIEKYAAMKSDDDISVIKASLVDHYYSILNDADNNQGLRIINAKRAEHLDKGIMLTIVGYMVLLFSTIALQFV